MHMWQRKTMADAHQQTCNDNKIFAHSPDSKSARTEALLYSCSSVETRPARNITYLPSASSFVNRWESAGSLNFSPLSDSLHLCPRVPVYKYLERTGWGPKKQKQKKPKTKKQNKKTCACILWFFNLVLMCRATIKSMWCQKQCGRQGR